MGTCIYIITVELYFYFLHHILKSSRLNNVNKKLTFNCFLLKIPFAYCIYLHTAWFNICCMRPYNGLCMLYLTCRWCSAGYQLQGWTSETLVWSSEEAQPTTWEVACTFCRRPTWGQVTFWNIEHLLFILPSHQFLFSASFVIWTANVICVSVIAYFDLNLLLWYICDYSNEISNYYYFYFLNHYAPVSQANWCNMTFTAGNLFPSQIILL